MRQVLTVIFLMATLVGCQAGSAPIEVGITPQGDEATEIIAAYLSQRAIFLDGVPAVISCRMDSTREAVLSQRVASLIGAGIITGVDSTCTIPWHGTRRAVQSVIGFRAIRVVGDTVMVVATSKADARCAYLEERGKLWRGLLLLREISLKLMRFDCGPEPPQARRP